MNENFKIQIIDKFKIKYQELVKKDIEDLLESLEDDFANIEDIDKRELITKNLLSAVKKTKYRYVKRIFDDEESDYNKDIQFAKQQYEKVSSKKISQKKLQEYFNTKTFKEYEKKRTEFIINWRNDEMTLLTDFPYFEGCKKAAINSAFKNDILVLFYRFIENVDNLKSTTKVPSILSSIPIDTTSRTYFLTDEQKKNLEVCADIDEPSTIDRYIMIDENEQNELLLQLEQKTYIQIKNGENSEKVLDLLTQIALIKSIKYLNRLDVKIISYYYTHFHKIVLEEPIVKSINKITSDLKMANTTKNYDAVESSIAKLGSTRLSYRMEGRSINGIFLESSIYEQDGIRMAKVYLGSILKELILKKSTLEYDEASFDSLGADAQQLAIWLQKRRYRCALLKIKYSEVISLNKLSTAIYWNTKRIDRKRDRLKVALEELSENKIVVREASYSKKDISFDITYIPLSRNEMAKINIGYDEGNLIENNGSIMI